MYYTFAPPNRQFYEYQKEESLCKTRDYVTNRLPKFMGYFERVLKSKPSGDGPWLHGGKLTYADLVLFQVIFFFFPLKSLGPIHLRCQYMPEQAKLFQPTIG